MVDIAQADDDGMCREDEGIELVRILAKKPGIFGGGGLGVDRL
ncbi:hypothetical protein [Roseivivax halotolerans]